jgi:NADH dehydrogenase FAD-containing subunit
LGVKKLNGEQPNDAAVAQAILFERALDTIEDIMVHVRRIPYDMGWTYQNKEEYTSDNSDDDDAYVQETTESSDHVTHRLHKTKKTPTVVVLGSGWAAHALMKVADCGQIRLIVVSPTNHFVFTPMLASASVGTVEYRSMTEAVRAANPMIHSYIEGSATDVDVWNKTVTVKLNSLLESVTEGEPPTLVIPYDTLVVSVGVRVSDFNVPGAATRTFKLKSCDDARRLRTAVGESFEYASRPDVMKKDDPVAVAEQSRRVTFLIVGGGPTGVELAGEISDLAHDITRERVGAYPKLNKAVKVILVQGLGELLPPFDPDLRVAALQALHHRGVDVKLNTRVIEVGDGFVRLSAAKLDDNGQPTQERYEYTLPVGLVAWCAGTGPVPFVTQLLNKLPDTARGIGGRITVDHWMRPPMPDPKLVGSVLVMGDAAAFEDSRRQSFLPQTAQVAGQQGAYAARLLNRGYDLTATPPVILPPKQLRNANTNTTDASALIDGDKDDDAAMRAWLAFRQLETAPGFNFLNLGLLAYVGGGKALSQVQIGDVPIFSYAGSVAFVLWRSVYLVKQVATRNRILVTFDWFKSALFGRDITRL